VRCPITILDVAVVLKSHEDATRRYLARDLPLPNNRMVRGNAIAAASSTREFPELIPVSFGRSLSFFTFGISEPVVTVVSPALPASSLLRN
jgi:hypothetical protein